MKKEKSGIVLRVALTILLIGLLSSCSPYVGVSVGIPFNAGGVYISPSIGVGGYL